MTQWSTNLLRNLRLGKQENLARMQELTYKANDVLKLFDDAA
ncbi:hypothetical protein ACNKHO_15605 [Shigella flexneri]